MEELLDLLEIELPGLMYQWSPCDNNSDYKCAFCHQRAHTNLGDITHDEDCSGDRLLQMIARLRNG